jgi:hypothetical protein
MININNRYAIGEYVKAYNNKITLDGVSNYLFVTKGHVKEIIIQTDIVTGDYIYLYRLDNGELYNEKSLMGVLS